jgi:hypothetical protein
MLIAVFVITTFSTFIIVILRVLVNSTVEARLHLKQGSHHAIVNRVHYINDIINFVAQLNIETCNLCFNCVTNHSVEDLLSENPLNDSLIGQACEQLGSLLDSFKLLLLFLFCLTSFFLFIVRIFTVFEHCID